MPMRRWKRMSLSVNTTSVDDGRMERDSKQRQDQGEMDVERAAEAELKSPAGRLFREAHFNWYIVALLGLGAPVAAARAGRETRLVSHPHLCSVQDGHAAETFGLKRLPQLLHGTSTRYDSASLG